MRVQIVVGTLVAMLILAVEHWFPWMGVTGRNLRLLERYIAGMLAIVIPVSVIFVLWESWQELETLWSVALGGGGMVLVAYGIDHYVAQKQRMQAGEDAERVLRDGTIDQG